jgi:pimeloyl-ACP methyl ester carboxylesterase
MDQSIVYVHGVPNSGVVWKPFVERTGGIAPDLPGFGASAKPADGDYTFRGLARFVSELTADMERFSLVVHDWGSLALVTAMERPEAIEKLVIINAVPFVPGYHWHTIARIWRTPVVGEVFMGLSSKWGFRRIGRAQGGDPEVVDALVEQFWPYFDHGTQRAILKLYRSAPESVLAEAGRGLGQIRAPALVVWGANDPYLPTHFAGDYSRALGGEARVELVEGGWHWPWLDKPETVDLVADFLGR